jgi:predicted metal-dependent HD superfamily phosphohydrolase
MDSVAGRAWVAAVTQLGGSAEAAAATAADLEHRYCEPHRRYHTLTHVAAVLDDAARLAAEVGLSVSDRAVVALAACAHDVVYAPRPGRDEQASAAWARAALTACAVPDEVGAQVAAIVLATISHTADVAVANVLLDADLAILAADPAEYARYVDGVRAEYSAVPDADWRTGRAAVLRRLLDRPALFATEPARRRWDARARRNLAAELAALSG